MKFSFYSIVYLLTLSSCLKETNIDIKTDYDIGIIGEISNNRQIISISRIPNNDLNALTWSIDNALVYVVNDEQTKFSLEVINNSKDKYYSGEYKLDLDFNWTLIVEMDGKIYANQLDLPRPSKEHRFWYSKSDTSLVFNYEFFDTVSSNIYQLNPSSLFGINFLDEANKLRNLKISTFGALRTHSRVSNIKIYPKREVEHFESFRKRQNEQENLFPIILNSPNTKLVDNAVFNIFHCTELIDSVFIEDNSAVFCTFRIKDKNGLEIKLPQNVQFIIKYKIDAKVPIYSQREYTDTIKSNEFNYSYWKMLSIFGVNNSENTNRSLFATIGQQVNYTLSLFDGNNFWEGAGEFIITRPPMTVDLIVRKL
jgi:hypothetical protein